MYNSLVVYYIFVFLPILVSQLIRSECLLHGEFSEQQDGKYSASTSVILTFYNITASDCIVRCTFVEGCMSINHKKDDAVCELLTTTQDSIVENSLWKYYTTDFERLVNGPYCQREEPCTFQQQCFDACGNNKYRCEPFPLSNIAREKPAWLSAEYTSSPKPASLCKDGNPNTDCHSSVVPDSWLKFDLQSVYRIYAVKVIARYTVRARGLGIYIGDIADSGNGRSNALFRTTDGYAIVRIYINNSLKFYGRYLFLFDDGNVGMINIMEVEIYGKV